MEGKVQVIIPMSGKGQRFIDYGYIDPKPLINIDGMPIIQHVVNMFKGETDFTFIINKTHAKETNMIAILKSIVNNCKIVEIDEHKNGPVYAVSLINNLIDDDKEVIVSYCDYGTEWNYNNFLKENREKNVDGAIPCYKGFHPHMLGSDNYAFVREKDNDILEIKEKQPFTDDKMNEYASNGCYYFKNGAILKKYFNEMLSDSKYRTNGEFYVSMIYNFLVRDGLKVNIFEIQKMLQWGTPYDLEFYKSWSNYFSNIIKPQLELNNPENTTTIFPMAGRGSRFLDDGYTKPKPFLDVNGKPMFIQALNSLPKSDKNIFIYLKEHEDFFPFDDTAIFRKCEYISIDYITDGQACTCEIGITDLNLEDPIMITACDNGVYYNVENYEKLLFDKNNDVIVWSFKNNPTSRNNPNMYAWLTVDDDDNIKNISCKKFIGGDPLKIPAIIGTMFFRKAKYFIDGLKKNYEENITTNGEFYVDDVLNQNIKSGLVVKNFVVDNYICWGTPNDYKTYKYWQEFFDSCEWHPYKIKNDITC